MLNVLKTVLASDIERNFILVGNALYNDHAKSVSDKNSIRVILTF